MAAEGSLMCWGCDLPTPNFAPTRGRHRREEKCVLFMTAYPGYAEGFGLPPKSTNKLKNHKVNCQLTQAVTLSLSVGKILSLSVHVG